MVFEFDAVGSTKPMKSKKNTRNWFQPDNEHSRKNASALASATANHTLHCFEEICSIYDLEHLLQM